MGMEVAALKNRSSSLPIIFKVLEWKDYGQENIIGPFSCTSSSDGGMREGSSGKGICRLGLKDMVLSKMPDWH